MIPSGLPTWALVLVWVSIAELFGAYNAPKLLTPGPSTRTTSRADRRLDYDALAARAADWGCEQSAALWRTLGELNAHTFDSAEEWSPPRGPGASSPAP